jgi:hypothetical protein
MRLDTTFIHSLRRTIMKTKYDTLKSSVIGTIAATLITVSAQGSAADGLPIWAGQFEAAYDSTSEQTESARVRSDGSSVKDAIVWANHFEQAYSGASQGPRVVTRPDEGKHLLWAGHFEQAYRPAREAVVPKSISIEVAMDR